MGEMAEPFIDSIYRHCLGFRFKEAEQEIGKALEAGVPRSEIMNGLVRALEEACRRYEEGRFCVAHLYAVASIFDRGYRLVRIAAKPKGKVLICTMGSMHYMGKNIVKLLLLADGFEVHDLGENVSPSQVVEAVERARPDVVALSVLLMACLPLQKEVERMLRERGLRSRVKLMVGGV
ncbi:TPA: hypothetical protein EYP44_03235, partial [Candidatus Bathyarchaeota archaeon]|nr:hypothetical protein [Candidatus Bathyarchaeota archaeon]